MSGAVGLSSFEAHAQLTITLIDVGSPNMTTAQLAAFRQAADNWELLFDDPIEVSVNISIGSLPANILGQTRTARATCPFDLVREAMRVDAAPGTEEEKVSLLPEAFLRVRDINGSRNAHSITMATANAKALSLGTGLDPAYSNPPIGIDGEIAFSNAVTFDTDRSDGISAGSFDLVGIAEHELGHLLGFFSLTDTQDYNPGLALEPNTLDIWRFKCPDGSACVHVLGTSRRQLTAEESRFYNGVRTIRLSSGATVFDDDCNAVGGACQASHWRDDQANLMDPTIGTGVQQDIESDDVHAMDYIGYSLTTAGYIAQLETSFGFMFVGELFGPPLPFGPPFNNFPDPPNGQVLDPPPNANVGFQVALVLDIPGLAGRSALGHLRFTPPGPVGQEVQPVPPDPYVEGQENLNPPGQIATMMPAALHDLVFVTEDVAGPTLHFRSSEAASGIQYNPQLGESGGYRVTGFLDGLGDGVQGDVDASVTFVLLADELPAPSPNAHNVFSTSPRMTVNKVIVYDLGALGALPICPADLDGNGFVGFGDIIILLAAWAPCTGCPEDLDGDGQVGFTDLILMLSEWGQCPS